MPGICVAESRKALRDNPASPRFIETVHGRGYRFIAQVTGTSALGSAVETLSVPHRLALIMVGREAELATMQGCFSQVLKGERQVVFVTGETGIGKITFVTAFLD
jgi:hypothetical protein